MDKILDWYSEFSRIVSKGRGDEAVRAGREPQTKNWVLNGGAVSGCSRGRTDTYWMRLAA